MCDGGAILALSDRIRLLQESLDAHCHNDIAHDHSHGEFVLGEELSTAIEAHLAAAALEIEVAMEAEEKGDEESAEEHEEIAEEEEKKAEEETEELKEEEKEKKEEEPSPEEKEEEPKQEEQREETEPRRVHPLHRRI